MPGQQNRKSRSGVITAAVFGVIALAAVGGWALSTLATAAGGAGIITNSATIRGDIKQNGRIVGVGLGARMIADDQVEFAEIRNAGELLQSKEFEFAGHSWRLMQVRELVYPSASQAGTSMMRVIAKMTH